MTLQPLPWRRMLSTRKPQETAPSGLRTAFDEGLDSPSLGILEIELVQVSLGLVTQGRLDDVFQGRAGDAVDPLQAHLVGGEVPDFFVVGDQVGLGQPLAEAAVAPLAQVFRLGVFVPLEVTDEAVVDVLLVEDPQAVLERVLDEAVLEVDLVGPLGIPAVFTEELLDQLVDLLALGKEDVAADVVAEAIFEDGLAEAAGASVRLEHLAGVLQVRAGG